MEIPGSEGCEHTAYHFLFFMVQATSFEWQALQG
jgi:hypothetical protein